DDTDVLHEYDLSAWGAPPAPANLADGVLARLAATDEAIHVAMQKQRRGSRRWWLTGGIAASLGAGKLGVWVRGGGGRGSHSNTPGAVIADKPRTISLGGTSTAKLEPGAELTWKRDGAIVHIEQRAGAVTWNVAGKDKLMIDAGATVASVEAAGGSLRVEV